MIKCLNIIKLVEITGKSLNCKISFPFPSRWSNFLPISFQISFPHFFPFKCQNILLEGNFLPSGSSDDNLDRKDEADENTRHITRHAYWC